MTQSYLLKKVNNAVKYAACKNLYIHIAVNKNMLDVSITDDGLGFELGAKENVQLGGNGMKGMQTRAKDIGGVLTIESTKGKGTTIVLTVPV